MTSDSTVDAPDSTTLHSANRGDSGVFQVAHDAKARLQRRELPGVAELLKEYPELAQKRTIVLDLAYEEYCQRCQAGETIDVRDFAGRFPSYEMSLYLFLNVRKLLDGEQPAGEAGGVAWPQPGESFLGFSLIEELGRGAFARVFLASEDALGGRRIALKVALRGGTEATTLGRLEHPNIVPVHSVQQDCRTGLTAVCMPFLGRVTLSDVLDRAFSGGSLPSDARVILDAIHDLDCRSERAANPRPRWGEGSYADAVVHLAIQLADALAHSHQRGICHRDIKPSNVLLTFDGRPLLLDFNLSVEHHLAVERIGGTFPYMAPEHLSAVRDRELAEQAHADPRSDVYSLGVILYQLLCGDLPFEPERWGGSFADVTEGMLAAQRRGAESIRTRRHGVSRQLESIVLQCLAFTPDSRVQTAAELADRLRRYFRPIHRTKRWVRRHPWRVAVSASLASAVLAGWGAYLAVRPAYSARMLENGLECYRQADFQQALYCFNECIQNDRSSGDAFIARGRTYLRLKQYGSALESFNAARRLSDEPLLCAAAGYCAASLGHHGTALSLYYAKAFDAGDRSASLLNNIGYSHLQQARSDEAERFFRMALERDPGLGAAYHNLLVVCLRRALAGGPVPADSAEIAARTVETAAPSAETYRDVAALYAVAAESDASLVGDALLSVKRALECGLDRDELAENPAFSALHGLPQFERLMEMPPSTTQAVKAERLVAPL